MGVGYKSTWLPILLVVLVIDIVNMSVWLPVLASLFRKRDNHGGAFSSSRRVWDLLVVVTSSSRTLATESCCSNRSVGEMRYEMETFEDGDRDFGNTRGRVEGDGASIPSSSTTSSQCGDHCADRWPEGDTREVDDALDEHSEHNGDPECLDDCDNDLLEPSSVS